MQKRFIFLLVAALLLGGLPMDVFSETAFNKELEVVILRVKELFSIPDEYDTFNSQVNSSGSNVYFYLNWSDSNNKLENISLSTDSQGNIISFNKYNPVYKEPETKLPNFSREQAQEKAEAFIKRVDQKAFNELKLEENTSPINSYDNDYNFNFTRVVNNIPYPDNSINVNVNKYTGEINNYYTNWERDIVFPKADNIIALENAKQAYKDEIGLQLMYKSSYRLFKTIDLIQETNYYLAYSTINNNKVIDAITGRAITLGFYGYGRGSSNEKTMDSELQSITPQERAEIDKLSGIKDVEEIEKQAREILGLDSTYTLQNKNIYSSYKNSGEFQWSLYFNKKVDDNTSITADITINAKTAELLGFYKDIKYNPDAKATITRSEALALAKDYINKVQPARVNQVELVEEDLKDGQLSYYFRFIRKTDEIYVESDSIQVAVGAVNKDIQSYTLDWFNGMLPPMGEAISLGRAYEVLFNDVGYELKYATVYDYEKPEGENKEIKLVYSVNPSKPSIINAHTGELLDYSGELYTENKTIEYIDLDKSYAKDKINTLSEYGVAFSSNEFKPKDKIKQRDYIYLLFKSMNSYRTETEAEIEKIYQELTNLGIIKEGEKGLDRIVTKEEAVKFAIRAMNYGKVAEIPNIYADLFPDSSEISPSLKGHINIAFGLGIINGDGSGMIKPLNELKREDIIEVKRQIRELLKNSDINHATIEVDFKCEDYEY